MFFKIDVLKNFAMFTRKHVWWNLFIIKLLVFRSRSSALRATSFIEHLRLLLLLFYKSSRSKMLFKIDVFKILFHRKDLCWSLTACKFIKETPVFSCEICKFSKYNFFYRTPVASFCLRKSFLAIYSVLRTSSPD